MGQQLADSGIRGQADKGQMRQLLRRQLSGFEQGFIRPGNQAHLVADQGRSHQLLPRRVSGTHAKIHPSLTHALGNAFGAFFQQLDLNARMLFAQRR